MSILSRVRRPATAPAVGIAAAPGPRCEACKSPGRVLAPLVIPLSGAGPTPVEVCAEPGCTDRAKAAGIYGVIL